MGAPRRLLSRARPRRGGAITRELVLLTAAVLVAVPIATASGAGVPLPETVYRLAAAVAASTQKVAQAVGVPGVPDRPEGDAPAGRTTAYQAAGAPPSGLGKPGDYYLDTDSRRLYLKQDDGWEEPVNLRGADGARGEAGPAGPAGAPGPAGADGADGTPGQDGAPGAAGETGEDGAPGAAGSDGAAGADGDAGSPGPAGPQGPEGPRGETGETGSAGAKGEAGAKGDPGPAGPAGEKGEPGAKGDRGDKGEKGDPGPQGEPGPQGPAGPAGATGALGPAGPQGPAGPPGAQGAAGAVGAQGPAGPAGLPGPAGTVAAAQLISGPVVQSGDDPSRGTARSATASCPVGTTLIGGGGEATADGSGNDWEVTLLRSRPDDATTWRATGVVTSGSLHGRLNVRAFALCV